MMQAAYRAGVVCAALALGGGLAAAERSKPLPRPVKALQDATRNFVKARSYHVELDVVGGYSQDAGEHGVNQAVVRETYAGDVYAGVMHVPKVKAYRTLKAGTAYVDGNWKNILSDLSTAKMCRLFRFPEVVLGNAIQHAARSGEWVPVEGTAPAGDKKVEPKEAESRESADDARSGRTIVRSGEDDAASSGKSPETERPRVIRVEAPPTEALQHILEVQNSNCFGVG